MARNAAPSGGGNGSPLSLAEVYDQAGFKPDLIITFYYIGRTVACQYRFHKNNRKFIVLSCFEHQYTSPIRTFPHPFQTFMLA
jgi:hypothetical protein